MLTKNNCVGKKKHRCRLQSNQISERVLAQISERHGSSNKKTRVFVGYAKHTSYHPCQKINLFECFGRGGCDSVQITK